MDTDNNRNNETCVKIEYSPLAHWDIDVRDMRKLFSLARGKIAEAIITGNYIKCATPYEAEATWFVARSKKISVQFYECGEDNFPLLTTQDKFWRIFASPMRELDLLRCDLESWESGVEGDGGNPIDNWLDEEDDD